MTNELVTMPSTARSAASTSSPASQTFSPTAQSSLSKHIPALRSLWANGPCSHRHSLYSSSTTLASPLEPVAYTEIDGNTYHFDELRRDERKVKRIFKQLDLDNEHKCECTLRADPDGDEHSCGRCDDDTCVNYSTAIECMLGECENEDCTNNRFQRRLFAPGLSVRFTGNCGHGLVANKPIRVGTFVIEYCGDVLDTAEMTERVTVMNRSKPKTCQTQSSIYPHFYMLALNGNETIDASYIGNVSRFINHSCDPNCATHMWSVPTAVTINGKRHSVYRERIGIFATRDICANEQITIDYKAERSGADEACYCNAVSCRGTLTEQEKSHKRKREVSEETVDDIIVLDDTKEEKHVEMKPGDAPLPAASTTSKRKFLKKGQKVTVRSVQSVDTVKEIKSLMPSVSASVGQPQTLHPLMFKYGIWQRCLGARIRATPTSASSVNPSQPNGAVRHATSPNGYTSPPSQSRST